MTVRPSTVLTAAAAIVVALALQTAVLSRLPLPGNAPNLLLVLVIAAALAGGIPAGIGMGFATGLAADLISDHPLGLLALVFLAVGLVVGRIEAPSERSVFWPVVIVAVMAVGSFLLYLIVYALIGRHGIAWGTQLKGLPEEVVYDVMLTPFVVPVVAAVVRRLRVAAVR
jgi:rod shape-determining protein MreD